MHTKPWLSSYPEGMPYEVNPDAYSSLIDLFDRCTQKYGDATAFINFGASLSYQQLHNLSELFAAYLQSQSLKKGARVAIVMPNLLQYAVAIMGILRAGMVVVNVNPLYTVSEMTHQLNDAGIEAVVILENFAITLQQALPQVPTLKTIIITEMGDLLGGFKGWAVNAAVKYIKRLVPSYHIPGAICFKTVLKKSKTLSFQSVGISGDDTAFLQYTGGTTGVPKAAILTHRNMVANVLQCSTWVRSVLTYNDTVIAALPLYHIFSLTVCCLTFMSLGAHCLLITNPKDMKSFVRLLQKARVAIFVGLNTLFHGLMETPRFKEIDFSGLKLTVSGGMPMQRVVAERWQQLTGCPVTEGYGLTETSPVVTINPVTCTSFSGSIGLPIPSTDITIRDDDGHDVPLNEPGELCVKGPQVMAGYWKKPEETALVMTEDGFLKTGDIAHMDDKGFIYIVDRKKDMIKVSGFNVYPNQIEEVIMSCAGVKEVAVVGIPYEKTGEAIKAVIVPRDPSLTEDQVKLYCRRYLTRYKIPRFIEFRDELPKSNIGKILRRELKAS